MLVALAAVVAVVVAASVPPKTQRSTPPTLPNRYFVQGLFQIPYFKTRVPITAWTDLTQNVQRVEYYNGLDTYLFRYDTGMTYEIVPVINQYQCLSSNVSGPTGTKRAVGGSGPQVLPLVPDVTNWTYKGPALVHNIDTDQFQTIVTNVTQFGTGHSVYTLYVDAKSRLPVQLRMVGINFIMDSHPDIYVFDYAQFTTGNFSDSEFDVPSLCSTNNAPAEQWRQRRSHFRARAAVGRLAALVPPTQHVAARCEHSVHPRFADFALSHRKHYASCEEHAAKQDTFLANVKFIEEWNADPTHTHWVGVNKYADLNDDEYRTLILQPRDGATRARLHAQATKQHQAEPGQQLPVSIDWRHKGAVNAVKDQGACGSCFAFGSGAALEGQWAIKKGALLSLSEQQVVDCSWGYFGNQACDGGFAAGVYQYLSDAGGVATESSYPYLEQDGWCNANDHSSGVKVTGYVNITDMPSLLSALATVGPIAIAMDASLPSFRFITHGIYYDPACKSDLDSLDHEVALVGFNCPSGAALCDQPGDYAILRNSWAAVGWGELGYAKISLKNNQCGWATSANYPLV